MNFEFLFACQDDTETNMNQVLTESLVDALENAQDNFDEDTVDDMIQFSHEYHEEGYTLIGFNVELELPDTFSHGESVIEDFVNTIRDKVPKSHVVKFEDPLLRKFLAERSAEIFDIEMKLRRVLSIIYLNAYQGEEPFRLLRDEEVKRRCCMNPIAGMVLACCWFVSCFFRSAPIGVCPDESFD